MSPILTCPVPVILACNDPANDALIATWLESASAIDACSEVTITNTYPDIETPDCGDAGLTTITFNALDACGNASSCESTITIEDIIAPAFELDPEDLVLECADPNNPTLITAWLDNNGGGQATDGCSAVTWSNIALSLIHI